ncbi:PhzF family phenazine biosynthesis protein [Calidifontimicrobium sp. SYSU G02091]|uniref:PhzF family phenazine biosynthesis protein n=1 Tax=Calidifontimicrobium sp. SYSU G02091 TaxID=2926421 RepID=UPI001F53920C|nr:PhzF family phenazine biosynthesis protein [Calidifontimicrobium sp. SYSU G02091]MCI1193799.1 PhzF family phenazine biosynthesis protein [Calidifontimicrobium sp. SYSU G02091]
MRRYRFTQLDVFGARALAGNPLAVVHDAQTLDDARMAAFARWTRLSETTYLLPPTDARADYRVRIFTPGGELPFAGHPTLGSAAAWLAAGGVPKDDGVVVQQCGVGLVRVRRDGARLAFAAPPLKRTGPLDEALLARIAGWLRVPRGDLVAHQHVDNGPGWVAVMLPSAAAVRALRPDFGGCDVKLGVVGPEAPGGETAFEVRAFFPGPNGMFEDPVTGSLNAGLAQWLTAVGLAPPRYVAAQGGALGADGRVHVERVGDDVWIGGEVAVCIEGTVAL